MNRRIDCRAVAKILEALQLQRQSALLALPLGSVSYPGNGDCGEAQASRCTYRRRLPFATEAEKETHVLVQQSIAEAIAIGQMDDHKAAMKTELEACKSGSRVERFPSLVEIGSVLEGRRLQELNLKSISFTASFNRSDLSGCLFAHSCVVYSTFNLTRLNYANFRGTKFHACTFISSEALEVDAGGAKFSHCIFRQGNLKRWNVCGATFCYCTFTLSDLTGWVFDGATTVLEPIDWSRCRRLGWHASTGCQVRECHITGHGLANAFSLGPPQKAGEGKANLKRKRSSLKMRQ